MKRRAVLASCGAALADPRSAADWQGIFAQMKKAGLEEGRNVVIERRFAMNDARKHYTNAEELVAARMDVIVAFGNERLAAAYKATKSIPIVPNALGIVELGYAKSLAQPGGNVTGFEYQALDYASKHFELLYALRPGLKTIGFAGAHGTPAADAYVSALRAAAGIEGVAVVALPNMTRMAEIEPMLAAAKRETVQVLALGSGMFFLYGAELQRIQAWATENKVVTSSGSWQRGELLVAHRLGPEGSGRVTWTAVRRILSGARPADIPIERPTRFEIIVSRKIARAMGLTIPQSVLLQATEVIE